MKREKKNNAGNILVPRGMRCDAHEFFVEAASNLQNLDKTIARINSLGAAQRRNEITE